MSLVIGLTVAVLGSVPAQAFSNGATFTVGSARIVVEDIALCTKYKYPFDLNVNGGIPWQLVGYETCPSESLTTDSLPATLHMKFRVQTLNADEFLPSNVDALITDGKGNKVVTPRQSPTPLFDLDGPLNIRDAVYYGAYSIADPKIFQAGSYTVTLQLWNSQWLKLKGPSVEEIPSSLNIFAFNIYAGKDSGGTAAGSSSSTTTINCKVDGTFEPEIARASTAIQNMRAKTESITDLAAPGILELVDSYARTIQNELANIQSLSAKAEAMYAKDNCYYYAEFQAYSTSAYARGSNSLNIVNGYYAKAKAVAGTKSTEVQSQPEPANCTTQNNSAITSIKNSINVLEQYSAKADSGMNLADKSMPGMLQGWLNEMELQYKNLVTWQQKLPEYYKSNPDCSAYLDSNSLAISGIVVYKNALAKVNTILNKAIEMQGKQSESKDDTYSDEDGVEEDPEANLSVTYSNALGRFIIKVDSNLPEDSLTIRATKKGSPTLRFTIKTNDEGEGGIRTKTKLSGYTLVLYYGSVKLDTARVK